MAIAVGQKTQVSKTIAVPADTNPWGDIFGGWILSLMDIAAGSVAARVAMGTIATKAINNVVFEAPIFVGDEVGVYATLKKIGRTSMQIFVEVMVKRNSVGEEILAVCGDFVMVALNEDRLPRAVLQGENNAE